MLTQSELLISLDKHIKTKTDEGLHPHTLAAPLFKEMLFEAYSYEKGDLDNSPALLIYAVMYLSHQKYDFKDLDIQSYIKQTPFQIDLHNYCEEVKNVNRLRHYALQVLLEIVRHISAQKKNYHYSINPTLLESVYCGDTSA